MKSRLFIILILLYTISASAQTSAIIVWEDRISGSNDMEFHSVIKTSDGGVITAGNTYGDGLVVKYNSSLSFEWSHYYGNGGNTIDIIQSIIECSDGGYAFAGTVGLSGNNNELWLVKTNDFGQVEWAYIKSEIWSQVGMDLVETNDGNILIIGQGDNPETGSRDYMASLVDQTGSEIWCQYYGITQTENACAVSRAEDNGFVIAGYGSTPENEWVIYLLRIDENGDVVWEDYFGGEAGRVRAVAMTKAIDGGYVLAGNSGSSYENVQIVKFDQSGNVLWSNSIPYVQGHYTSSITNTMDGGFLISGFSQIQSHNQWLLKIDSLGNFIWDQTFVSDQMDYAWSVEYLDEQNYLLAGSSDLDAYITKISPVKGTGEVVVNEIMINPDQANDSDGEWFELMNTSDTIVNIHNWQVLSGGENYLVESEIFLHPSEFIVFGVNTDPSLNGGVNVFHEYSGISFNNYEDEIVLYDSLLTLIDSVSWNGSNGFPLAIGASSALLNLQMDNEVGANWFLSNLTFGGGDFGTPNNPNYISIIEIVEPIDELPVTMVGASNTISVIISNTGNDTLSFEGVTSSNSEFELVLIDSLIDPFTESQADLLFTPTEIGERSSTITLFNSAYGLELYQFDVSGNSIPANPDISCVPDTIKFLINYDLDSLMQEVTISNDGTLDLTINDIELTSFPNDYSLSIHSGVVSRGRSILLGLGYQGSLTPIPGTNSLVIYSNDPDESAFTIPIVFQEPVRVELENIPESFTLNQNYPNPFNPTTTLSYGLPEESEVSLIIYDIRGKSVKTFVSQSQNAGWYAQTWNGLNDNGEPVSTGIYLARLHAGSYSRTIKMLYLK